VPKRDQTHLRSAETVQMDTHAVATLRYIRASMDSAAVFAVPGSAGIAMGSVGLLAALVSAAPGMHTHWFTIWLCSAVIAAAAGGTLVVRPSSLRGLTLSATPMARFALSLLPSIFGGAIMTAVLWSCGNVRAIPGTWLLLYGCALLAASVATTRTIGIMGGSFILLGLWALVLPENCQNLMLGVGFGGLHVLFGFLIGRMGHGRQI
jgi:hypothetical protein